MSEQENNQELTSTETSQDKKTSLKREIMEWIIVIEIAVILAVVLNMFLIVNAVIPSASMETTIMTGDRIFGTK